MAPTRAAALSPIDVGAREPQAVGALGEAEVDALIVTSPSNIRWLTGFAGSNALVTITGDEIVLFTDYRYQDRAPIELSGVGSSAEVVVAVADLGERVAERLDAMSAVALEADHISWQRQRLIADEWLTGTELVPTVGLLDGLRAAKDPAEVDRIRAAAAITDAALGDIRPLLGDRPTERAFAAALESAIRAAGADDIAFDAIVASGPNGAVPHHSPGDRVIESGDLVIVDVGARVDGYRSDMTRTFSIGPMTTDQARHYDTVIAAQQAGVEAMVVGAATRAVDEAARGVIDDAGWGDSFTHGTGHGVGLDIHELPRVSATATDYYRVGTVATVEPGVYLRGVAGVRIEDTCVVTTEGAQRLTGFSKDPEI